MDLATARETEILLIEDNLGDVGLTRELLNEMDIPFRLNVARDGQEAMAFLYRLGSYSNAPRPDLILLDLNLPKKNGREVLADIKQDPCLRQIPVLIFTTSGAERDIAQTYALHANSYIIKPFGIESSATVARSIESFWFRVSTLPPA